jgi:hypothetical protein
MNDDIVTRLRESFSHPDVFTPAMFLDAADEIERLRAELAEWKALANMPQSSPAPRMTCTQHGIKYLCFDDFMDGVWWCSKCNAGDFDER